MKLHVYFPKLHPCAYFRAKFQITSYQISMFIRELRNLTRKISELDQNHIKTDHELI